MVQQQTTDDSNRQNKSLSAKSQGNSSVDKNGSYLNKNETIVSKPCAKSTYTINISLSQILDYLESFPAKKATDTLCERFQSGIESKWEGQDKTAYQHFKAQNFSIIYPSLNTGKPAKGRTVQDGEHTGLMDIDLDECSREVLEDFVDNYLHTEPHIMLAANSVSGGVSGDKFALIAIDLPISYDCLPEVFQEVLNRQTYIHDLQELFWMAVIDDLNKKYDLNIKGSHGKSPLSGRYLGHDPDYYYNEEFTPYPLENLSPYLTQYKAQKEAIAAELAADTGEKTDLTQACVDVLKEHGEGLFSEGGVWFSFMCASKRLHIEYEDVDDILGQSEGYNATHNLKRWNNTNVSRGTADSIAGIGTLIHYAKLASREAFDTHVVPLFGSLLMSELPEPDPPDYVLQPRQYLSDLHLEFPAQFTRIHSPAGSGKSAMWTRDYCQRYPNYHIVMIEPTRFIAQQKGRDENIPIVLDGDEYDYELKIQITSLASFVKKFDPERPPEHIVIFDEAHIMQDSASPTYLLYNLTRLREMLKQAGMVVEMTATPINLYGEPRHYWNDAPIETLTIVQEDATPLKYRITRYEDTLKAIELRLEKGKTLVSEINSRKYLEVAKEYFEKKGCTVGVIYKETDKDYSDLYEYVKDNRKLDKHYDLVLTTSLFELGVDVYGCDLAGQMIFPVKRHDTRHQMDAVIAPHKIVQYANRFRQTDLPVIDLMIPAYSTISENDVPYYDPCKLRDILENKAKSNADLLNYHRKFGKFRQHNKKYRETLAPDLKQLVWFNEATDQFEPNYVGIDFKVYEMRLKCMTQSLPFYKFELAKEGLIFEGEEVLNTEKSQADTKLAAEAIDLVNKTHEERFLEELEELENAGWKDIVENQSPTELEYQYKTLSGMSDRVIAAAILKDTMGDKRKFKRLQDQFAERKHRKNPDKIAFKIREVFGVGDKKLSEFTSLQAHEIMKDLMKSDPFLSNMYSKDSNKRDMELLSQTKTTQILKQHFDIDTKFAKKAKAEKKSVRSGIDCIEAENDARKTAKKEKSLNTHEKSVRKRWLVITSETPLEDYVFEITEKTTGYGRNLDDALGNKRYNIPIEHALAAVTETNMDSENLETPVTLGEDPAAKKQEEYIDPENNVPCFSGTKCDILHSQAI